MLTVDQGSPAVCRLAAREQERIAAWSHERVRGNHGAQPKCTVAKRTLRHSHHHPTDERFIAAARTTLLVVDKIELGMRHRAPIAEPPVNSFVRRGVGHPACAGAFARHCVGTKERFHLMSTMPGMLLICAVLCVARRCCLTARMALMVLFRLGRWFFLLRLLTRHVLGVLRRIVLRMIHLS